MARRETSATAPARLRKGLPVVSDGSRQLPLLVALHDEPRAAECNNGCDPCVTEAARDSTPVGDRHVVIRDREPTLVPDLAARIAAIRRAGPASLSLLTNGRVLLYAERTRALARAGLDRVIVKLFGVTASAHDAHTRTPGSFEQALEGIARARESELEVHITYPHGPHAQGSEFAREVSGSDPVVFPEPQVDAHAGEYRVDLVALRRGITQGVFANWYFPMVHVQTGPRCNLRCLYCNVHGGDDPRLFDKAYIEQLVELAVDKVLPAPHGRATLDFIGGEPTLHPDLPDLIRFARASGFDEVSICTNGVLLHKRPALLDELVDAGLTMLRYSLHSHDTDTSNALADVRGLDESYVSNAKRLLRRGDLHTHFYRILLRDTVKTLPAYLRFLAEHNETGRPIDLSLGMPSMRGRLFDNPHLYPDLDAVRDAVREALAMATELDIEIFLHHTPACLVPEAHALASCLSVSTLQVETDVVASLSFEGDARHIGTCSTCAARDRGCQGIPGAYVDTDREKAERWAEPVDARGATVHYDRRADL